MNDSQEPALLETYLNLKQVIDIALLGSKPTITTHQNDLLSLTSCFLGAIRTNQCCYCVCVGRVLFVSSQCVLFEGLCLEPDAPTEVIRNKTPAPSLTKHDRESFS